MLWRGRNFEFDFARRRTLIMGVLNVTPDSFSDGGSFLAPAAAVEQGLLLVSEGADMLDIGGESSRPGAEPVSEAEELRRVLPVLQRLAPMVHVPISIDTTKWTVARRALEAGAVIVNDIAGHRKDPALWRLLAATGAGYVLMHMKGTPQTMPGAADYDHVTADVTTFFEERLRWLQAEGVRREQIALDPGLGFAKTAEHNLQLLAALPSLTKWDRPLVVGASRKSFIGKVTGAEPAAARLPGSLACACWAVASGAGVIRTHDPGATRQATRMIEAILHYQKYD